MKNFLLGFTFCLITYTGFGQDSGYRFDADSTYRLDIGECINIAINKNLNVQYSRLDVLNNQANLDLAKANLIPSVNSYTGYSHNVGRSINPFTNQFEDQPVTSQNYGVNAEIVLFNQFKKINTLKKGKLDYEVSQYDLESTKNQVILSVIEAYTDILLNEALLENARTRLQTTELQLDRTQKLVNSGVLIRAELLQIQAQQANDNLAITNAQNNLDLARLRLKQIMQIPAQNGLEVVNPAIEIGEDVGLTQSIDNIYSNAIAVQPVVKSVDMQEQSAAYNVSIAKADFYPTLSLNGGLFTSYSSIAPGRIPKRGAENEARLVPTGAFIQGNPDMVVVQEQKVPSEFTENNYWNQLEFNFRRGFGLSLSIPIFNNYQVRSSVNRAKLAHDEAKIRTREVRTQLRQNIEQAYLTTKAAIERFNATRKQVASLEEAFANTEKRFNLGVMNAVDYNQARNELNQAETDLIQAKYDYFFNLKVLDFYQNQEIAWE